MEQIVQMMSQMAAMHKQLSEGLQATNANLAQLVAASDRRAEVMMKESRDVRARHWDDGEKFRNCKTYSGRGVEWEEWSQRLMGTIKTRANKVHALMKLVELNVSDKVLEGDN